VRSTALEQRNKLSDDDRQEMDGNKNELSQSFVGATETPTPNASICNAEGKVIDKNSTVDTISATRAMIDLTTNADTDRTDANPFEWLNNEAADLFTNMIFDVNNDDVDDNNFDESVECDRCLHEHMTRANDMKWVLKIKRRNGLFAMWCIITQWSTRNVDLWWPVSATNFFSDLVSATF